MVVKVKLCASGDKNMKNSIDASKTNHPSSSYARLSFKRVVLEQTEKNGKE